MKQIARWLCVIALLCTIGLAVIFICISLDYITSDIGKFVGICFVIGTPILDAIALVMALTQI